MNTELYAQITQDFKASQTTAEKEAFKQKQLERVLAQTPEENQAELAFLEQEFLAIQALVAQAREQKLARV
jgi:hypothetical protein